MYCRTCNACGCPLMNLKVSDRREKRRYCASCKEKALASRPSKYGTLPLEKRLKKRETKRLWAQKNRERLYARAKELRAADPEKYAEARRVYVWRMKERKKAGRPSVRDVPEGTP